MDSPKGFEKPNHTQTPNSFFDESLKYISSLPELKVVLAIIRKTLGWQKEKDRISMSQIRLMTGLAQQSVKRGIDLALKHGFIVREPVGQHFVYSLKLVTPCDQSHLVTSNTTLPEVVTPCDQKLVTPCYSQKKGKEKKETSAHSRLMAFHDSHLAGGMPDGAAQAAAVKWLLARFTSEECEAEYKKLRSEEWRTTPVTWLTVKKQIGADLARGNGNGHSDSGEKILTDYGDWYTVEGFDGTPSKRYRTAEAFARETGRNLEEVLAKWN